LRRSAVMFLSCCQGCGNRIRAKCAQKEIARDNQPWSNVSPLGTEAHDMRKDVTNQQRGNALFRSTAVRAAGNRLFGSVSVITPPSSIATLLLGLSALLVLGFVAWYVEVPQRARAAGVLMPPGGFLDVVADAPGRIAAINVAEGQIIRAGDTVLTVTTDQKSLVLLQLQSLRQEIALLNAANAHQETLESSHAQALTEHLDALGRQLDAARTEYELQRQQVALLERRLQRRQGLVNAGNVSSEALDREQSLLLRARAGGAGLARRIIEIEQQAAGMQRNRTEAIAKSGRRQVLHELEQQRVQRQVEEHEYLIDREIRAPESGTVARVIARQGATVRAGDPLVRIYHPGQGLEAWLYLESSRAAFLRPGQSVQLQLDAYPYQLFGTSSATITSVSTIAIVPRELTVPLLLDGPVFEVRAALDQEHVDAFDAIWRLAPGTSFQADLIQRRYRLYEWLLRAAVNGSDGRRGKVRRER